MDEREQLKLAALSTEISDAEFENIFGSFKLKSMDDLAFTFKVVGKYRPECAKKLTAQFEKAEVMRIATLDDLNRWLSKKGLAIVENEHGFQLKISDENDITFHLEGGTENPDPPHPENGSRDWLVLRVNEKEIKRK